MWASAKRAHLHPRFAKSPGKHQPTTVVGSPSRPRSGPPTFRFPQRMFPYRSLRALKVTGEMHDRSSRCCPRGPTKALDKPKELMASRDGHRGSLRQLRCLTHQDGPSAGALIVAVCAAEIGRLVIGGRIIKVRHD